MTTSEKHLNMPCRRPTSLECYTHRKVFLKYQCNARFPSLCLASENAIFGSGMRKKVGNPIRGPPSEDGMPQLHLLNTDTMCLHKKCELVTSTYSCLTWYIFSHMASLIFTVLENMFRQFTRAIQSTLVAYTITSLPMTNWHKPKSRRACNLARHFWNPNKDTNTMFYTNLQTNVWAIWQIRPDPST